MVWALGFISAEMIHAMIRDYGAFVMDITTYTMLLCTKLWGLSWALRDGYMGDDKIWPEQVKRKVVEVPSLFKFSAFVFFMTGCIVGPFMEFSDFENFIELKNDYENLPQTSFWPSMRRLLDALILLGIHVYVSGILGFSVYYCGKEEFLTYKTYWHRLAFYNIAMQGQKGMYFSLWCFQDAATIASGIGWDGKGDWYKLTCIRVFDLETAWSCKEMMGHWNHQVSMWLNRYVQDRMLEYGKRPDMSVTIKTFAISAFWHGFYPFYYIMFFWAGLCLELAKEVFRNRDLFEWMPYYLKWFLANQLTMFQMNYLGVSFNQLTFERGYNMAKGTGFIVWIATPIALGIMKGISAMRKSKPKKIE